MNRYPKINDTSKTAERIDPSEVAKILGGEEVKDAESPCPLNNNAQNHNSRYNPYNAAAAYCFQLHDMLRVLYGTSHSSDSNGWKNQIKVIQSHLDIAKGLKW